MPEYNHNIQGKKFLITGGAGFIGSHIVEYLLQFQPEKVRVLDNISTGSIKNIKMFQNRKEFEFIKGDIRDTETCVTAVEGMDYVLHQAALGSVPRSLEDPLLTNDVNITGFLQLLIASRDAQVKRFVYAASSSTYGDSTVLPKIEDIIGKPLSPYAVTKYVNELYAYVFGLHYGLETIGLRYFNVFGPRQDPNGAYAAVIPLFIHEVLNVRPVFINGDGEQTRDFTYVDNVIQANIRALFTENQRAIGSVFNVAVGETISINRLVQLIGDITGIICKTNHRSGRKGDVRDSLADISRAKEIFGYEPTVYLREGLERTIQWFKENGG
jgi:UDP-N-acetylglucosamine 4-epimerase